MVRHLRACWRDISERNNINKTQPLTVGNTAVRGFLCLEVFRVIVGDY